MGPASSHLADLARPTLGVIWTIALFALAVWSLLAWGGHALLDDSGARLFALVDPWIASARWDQHVATVLSVGEGVGTAALWAAWALGATGLLLTSAFATLLYRRAQRAMAASR
jgi:hypothetical protein